MIEHFKYEEESFTKIDQFTFLSFLRKYAAFI